MISKYESWGEQDQALSNTASRYHFSSGVPVKADPREDRGRMRFLRWVRAVAFFWILLAVGSSAGLLPAEELAPSEAQVKAAFLLNFPKYVNWPAEAFPETNSPVVVGIFGDDEVAEEFSAMDEGKHVNGHPIQLLRVKTMEQCHGCQVLFVGAEEERKSPDLLSQLKGMNILTVGESDEFLDQGGMINLSRKGRQIQLEVNLDSVRQTGLKISSKLLAVATVRGGKR